MICRIMEVIYMEWGIFWTVKFFTFREIFWQCVTVARNRFLNCLIFYVTLNVVDRGSILSSLLWVGMNTGRGGP